MKNYYLYLDPDDGILYVQKDGEVIAPVRTSASFDPKTIRIDDGYLQVKDFVSDAWIYICDKDGNAVSLKGPSGETVEASSMSDLLTKELVPGMYIVKLRSMMDQQPELPELPDAPIEKKMNAPIQINIFGLLLISRSTTSIQSMVLILDDGVYINKNTDAWMEVKWDNIASMSNISELETRLSNLATQLAEQQSLLSTINLEEVASVYPA